jgi:hypothetical protein
MKEVVAARLHQPANFDCNDMLLVSSMVHLGVEAVTSTSEDIPACRCCGTAFRSCSAQGPVELQVVHGT